MESKAGFTLALIGGILQLLSGIILLIVGILGAAFLGSLAAMFGSTGIGAGVFGGVMIFLAVVTLIFGVFMMVAGFMMKKPEKVKTGGILAIIFGGISFLAGFGTMVTILPGLLALIGGILGLVAAKK